MLRERREGFQMSLFKELKLGPFLIKCFKNLELPEEHCLNQQTQALELLATERPKHLARVFKNVGIAIPTSDLDTLSKRNEFMWMYATALSVHWRIEDICDDRIKMVKNKPVWGEIREYPGHMEKVLSILCFLSNENIQKASEDFSAKLLEGIYDGID